MDIRIAGPNDSTAIAELHAESWKTAYRGILADEYLDEGILSERLGVWRERLHASTRAQYVVVAEEQGALAGFACAYGDADHRWGTNLDNIHVLPNQKRKGLGKSLFANVASWSSRNYPGQGLFLWVFERNLAARHFYDRLGGMVAGRKVWMAPEGTQVEQLRYVWKNPTELTF